MIFNSLTFLLFLPTVVALYWILPRNPRIIMIFFSSLIFYGFWRIEFIPVMMISVFSDYYISLKMISVNQFVKKRLLILSIVINLSLLFYFKYLIFFANNAIGFMNMLGFEIDPIFLNIILPLGISFYTFQTISYSVDVYRGFIKPERNFFLYASYVTFFPQLVAGPVLRASEVIHQLSKRTSFSIQLFISGAKRIIYGLFLKVVLADNIAPLVDTGFLITASELSALDVLTLSFLFGFQIYFDFSAYSHIAIGCALLMGIKFPENFNFPYLANSPKDFWKRWHISLSSWIRDYLYLPLTGTKVVNKSIGGIVETPSRNINSSLFYTWAIMGLWHGANWTFVVWGLYHAVFIFLHRKISSYNSLLTNNKIIIKIGAFLTLPIMMLGWIPFRADSIEATFQLWSRLFNLSNYTFLGMRENTYLVAFILLVGMYLVYFINNFRNLKEISNRVNYLLYPVIISLIFIFLRPINQFIYFQF